MPNERQIQIAAPLEKIQRLEALRRRKTELARTDDPYLTPGHLARALDPMTVQTPTLDILDAALGDVDLAVEAMLKRRRLYAKYRGSGMDEVEARDCAEAEVPSQGKDRLLISCPPQEGKSDRCSRYGVLWMLRRHPELRIAVVSYGEGIAQNISYNIRSDIEIYNGEEGNVDVGLRLQGDSRAKGQWRLQGHRGSVYAIGIGGSLTGRPVDLMVIDDPVKDFRDADSMLLSEQAWEWWQSVARTRLAPGAPVVVILTRWHEGDLAGRLLTKQREDEKSDLKYFDRWNVINIPAQADYDPAKGEIDPLGREPGEFMLSARGRTQAQWEAVKGGVTPRIWSALYQGKPTPDSGDVFHRNWWMRYSTPIWTEQTEQVDGKSVTACYVHDATEVLQSWDMTFKDTKGTDFVVGQIWARKGAFAYLLDEVRARMSFTDSVAAVRSLTAKWPQATVKLIEEKANGAAVINSLRQEIGGIIPVVPKESKQARASAISPVVESNNVFLPEREIALYDVDLFIEECTQFPNAAHDDQVDAMTQALDRMFLKGSGGKDWLESLAPPCPHCGQPNVKGIVECVKCGEELPRQNVEEIESEEFSLVSGMSEPTTNVLDPNQAVRDAISQFGPQNFQPFGRNGW